MNLLKKITAGVCAVGISLSLSISAAAVDYSDLLGGDYSALLGGDSDEAFGDDFTALFGDMSSEEDYAAFYQKLLDAYQKTGTLKDAFLQIMKDNGASAATLTQYGLAFDLLASEIASYSDVIIAELDKADLTEEEKTLVYEILGLEAPTAKGGKISAMTISKIDAETYTGKSLKPDVVIKDGSYTLKKGTDYTLTYSNNKKVGKATVKITGKGSYSGTVSKTFKINPAAPTDLAVSFTSTGSAKISWTKALGAGGYQIYYSDYNDGGFKKLASSTKLSYSTKKITESGIKYIKVRAYKTVSGTKYYSDYSDILQVGKVKNADSWEGVFYDAETSLGLIIAQNADKTYTASLVTAYTDDDDEPTGLSLLLSFDMNSKDFNGKTYSGTIENELYGSLEGEIKLTDTGLSYSLGTKLLPLFEGTMTREERTPADMLKLI